MVKCKSGIILGATAIIVPLIPYPTIKLTRESVVDFDLLGKSALSFSLL